MLWAHVRYTTSSVYARASERHKDRESGDWEWDTCATFRSFWRTKRRSRPPPFPFQYFCLRRRGLERSRIKKVKEMVVGCPREESSAVRGAIPRNRSVRRSLKPLRAPRVAINRFAIQNEFEKDSRKSKTGTKPVFSEPKDLNIQSIALLLFCASKKAIVLSRGAGAKLQCA